MIFSFTEIVFYLSKKTMNTDQINATIKELSKKLDLIQNSLNIIMMQLDELNDERFISDIDISDINLN